MIPFPFASKDIIINKLSYEWSKPIGAVDSSVLLSGLWRLSYLQGQCNDSQKPHSLGWCLYSVPEITASASAQLCSGQGGRAWFTGADKCCRLTTCCRQQRSPHCCHWPSDVLDGPDKCYYYIKVVWFMNCFNNRYSGFFLQWLEWQIIICP